MFRKTYRQETSEAGSLPLDEQLEIMSQDSFPDADYRAIVTSSFNKMAEHHIPEDVARKLVRILSRAYELNDLSLFAEYIEGASEGAKWNVLRHDGASKSLKEAIIRLTLSKR